MEGRSQSLEEMSHHFIDALEKLETALQQASKSFHANPMPIWTHRDAPDPCQWLETALGDIWYKEGQAGNQSTPYVGLVGATPHQISLLHAVNEAKHVFQDAGQALKAASIAEFQGVKRRVGEGRGCIQPMLNASGVARLHLKQAWRRLPIAEQGVRRVHFSWYSSGRTIKRMTVAEADEALCRLDVEAPHVRIQREKLASLPSDEVLAQVRPQTILMRANITFLDPTPALRMHQAMNVGMPLFVPLMEGQPLPDHNEPAQEPPVGRQWPKRRDAKLEDDPFLPSVHVHRYRDTAAPRYKPGHMV